MIPKINFYGICIFVFEFTPGNDQKHQEMKSQNDGKKVNEKYINLLSRSRLISLSFLKASLALRLVDLAFPIASYAFFSASATIWLVSFDFESVSAIRPETGHWAAG